MITKLKCEACGLEATIRDPAEFSRVDCPDCGAGYIRYNSGWRCIVRPVFEEVEIEPSKKVKGGGE